MELIKSRWGIFDLIFVGSGFLVFDVLSTHSQLKTPLCNVPFLLRCINFLVYDDAILEPGPGLNLLVGPNGSGKTTWADAILIGLGASPKVFIVCEDPFKIQYLMFPSSHSVCGEGRFGGQLCQNGPAGRIS